MIPMRDLKFPELASVQTDARRRALRACRWKFLRFWQIWLTLIAVNLFGIILVGVAGIWIFNCYYKVYKLRRSLKCPLCAQINYPHSFTASFAQSE
jgi:hypothetical protein